MLSPGLRWFFGVAAVLALIAGILLFVLATETDRYFSWTIEPPLTAAYLGAAYWAACVLLAWAARQQSWAMARTTVAPVLTIAALLLIATLTHLDKFDMDSVFGWFWLAVYIIVPPLLIYLVVEQVRSAGDVPQGARPLSPAARGVLAAQGVVLLVVGSALFVVPGRADSLWPWELTPLTSEAVGAFLVGFAVGAAGALQENDLDRLRGSALAYATLGALELAALAIHSDDVTAGGARIAVYVAFCGSVVAAGSYGLIARSAASRSS